MRPKSCALAFILIFTSIGPTPGFAGDLLCPQRLTGATSSPALPLTDADVWAGHYELSIEDAEEHKDAGRRLWARWKFGGLPHPRFIACRYGTNKDMDRRPEVIIPIPEGGEPCELDIRGRNQAMTLWDVLTLACTGPAMSSAKTFFPTRPSRATELGGMNLEMTRAAVKASILARGGAITAKNDSHLDIMVNNERFVVHFPPNRDRPDEIVALLPPRKGESMETYFDVVQRFGTPYLSYPYPDRHWSGLDNVWVVYHPGGIDSGEPQEIRLLDHVPPRPTSQ